MSVPNTMGTEYLSDGMTLPVGFLSDSEKTFQYQDQLPSLPVPRLADTLAKYLESVKPFVSDEEFLETEAMVKRFQCGAGKDLNERFVEKCKNKRNWLEKWWEEYAYLRNREPHTPFVNFAGPGPYIDTYWPPREGSQIERGAMALWFSLKYWQILRQQRLQVDRGGRTTVWCMEQVHRMFNGGKTPGHFIDELHYHFKTEEEGSCPTHILVLSNGRFYRMNILHDDGNILTVPELQIQLSKVLNESQRHGPGCGLGTLTTENRTTWAKLRDHLISMHPDNRCHLAAINEAVLLICLDDRSPLSIQELSVEALCGNPANRWFDKTLQLIVFSNGTIACNGDHAPYDAMAMINLTWWMCRGIQNCGQTWEGRRDIRPLADPEELVFHLDPVIMEGIAQARAQYDLNASSIEMYIDKYRNYGKTLIRQYNYHPDTFVQMALQYAYYRMYKKPAPTYETASTRKFYHGRTETVRSCTMEALQWTRAMLDEKVKNIQKLKLFKTAMDKHLKLMKEAMENRGCDRHLFGLQITASEDKLPTPEIFTHPSWTKSGGGGNFVLSTSCVGFTPCFGGVAPMCKDGFGVFYSIIDDSIQVFVSSWRADETSSKAMFDSISQSLDDLKQLMTSCHSARL